MPIDCGARAAAGFIADVKRAGPADDFIAARPRAVRKSRAAARAIRGMIGTA
jgi:hypothetical protein